MRWTFSPWILFLLTFASGVLEAGRVERFTPEGTVSSIRQVQVLFSEAMVGFGDPAGAEAPFEVACPHPGSGRWVDTRSWVYDFEGAVPSGLRCNFRLRDSVRTLVGEPLAGERVFSFSTGGPSVLYSHPWEGSESVHEDQIFILVLDGEVDEASIGDHVSFSVDGVVERIGARIVRGDDREAVLATQWFPTGQGNPLLLIRAERPFPPETDVSLVWGRGVRSPAGVPVAEDRVLSFRTREPFLARLVCRRENPDADCVPLTPIRLSFSAPVLWSEVAETVLRGEDGRTWRGEPEGEVSDPQERSWVRGLVFQGPFPIRARFLLDLPGQPRDDSGRSMVNLDRFPLPVRTADFPPLVKFSASFGILESGVGAVLPVTLRNVEKELRTSRLDVKAWSPWGGEEDPRDGLNGRVHRVSEGRVEEVMEWIRTVQGRGWDDRERSVFERMDDVSFESFTLPRPGEERDFEVVGIPLPGPGFYVVEIESLMLGSSLLGEPRPMYVPTTALVTDLSVHFKWGNESSLVWVTSLDSGRPVGGARVEVWTCEGNRVWAGTTDSDGLARPVGLPAEDEAEVCSWGRMGSGLLVTARKGEDFSFVHNDWDDGIQPWRFRIPTEWDSSMVQAVTVLDRTLLRAGETLHMKHFLRRRSTEGFAPVSARDRPRFLRIEHLGSGQHYELAVEWDSSGIAETRWEIPRESRLGSYRLSLSLDSLEESPDGFAFGRPRRTWETAEFRIEEYRVPLLRGSLGYPSEPLVGDSEVVVDLNVHFLAGGGAGGLPVRVRYYPEAGRSPRFPDFEDYRFGNGPVEEELIRSGDEEPAQPVSIRRLDLTLDSTGSARALLKDLSAGEGNLEVVTEAEFRDPNGQVQTLSARIPLWGAERLVGIHSDRRVRMEDGPAPVALAVVDLEGNPVVGAPVRVDLFQRLTYSHRKRLVGGFYAYEHFREIRRVGPLCSGLTGEDGRLRCVLESPVSGHLVLVARTDDARGRTSSAHTDVWLAGEDDWWFDAEDHDRIDVIPEKTRYEPGEAARLQVRVPFREGTALVTVEREGVGRSFVRRLNGREPVVEVPLERGDAPNTFVSVLVVRGRVAEVQPTATVDLGRPAFKLGFASLDVGWGQHRLEVAVSPDRTRYRVRETARVKVSVSLPDGSSPGGDAEVALAAVDQGLLELMPNTTWELLEAMMRRRSLAVRTSTAQMHVVGRRHFGLKAVPEGGGGGKQTTRELFDTLLLWKGRIRLDEAGEAVVEVPLNDSLTEFRIVAVASTADRFGTGSAVIRSSQELMILSGLAPVVREGDRIRNHFTVRNTSERPLRVEVEAAVEPIGGISAGRILELAAGEAREIEWTTEVPVGVESLRWVVEADSDAGFRDRLAVEQRVVPAVPVTVQQAVLERLESPVRMTAVLPVNADPERGGLRVSFHPTLTAGLDSVADYMRRYPYNCIEQRASQAVVLRDEALWRAVVADLPAFMDSRGLVDYFPSRSGDEVLTAYLLSLSAETGWGIPDSLRRLMLAGLLEFLEGRIESQRVHQAPDLTLRKLAAAEALSRWIPFSPSLLDSIPVSPRLWPTSALLDWYGVLRRRTDWPDRERLLKEAEELLRSRTSLQGGALLFTTEGTDRLWWLMVSPDLNAARLILALLEEGAWKQELPRLVRGLLLRQRQGRWDLTTANAWGVLAVEKFSGTFEKTPVAGTSMVRWGDRRREIAWGEEEGERAVLLPWTESPEELILEHLGEGAPWVRVESRAAVSRTEELAAGMRIRKSWTAVERRQTDRWSRGDLVRVRLEMTADTSMSWVVVDDPIPAGSVILGGGLGQDTILEAGGNGDGRLRPAYEERTFRSYRAYFRWMPEGRWEIEYILRLNNPGSFRLPPTRIEALYLPEMMGESPNPNVEVQP